MLRKFSPTHLLRRAAEPHLPRLQGRTPKFRFLYSKAKFRARAKWAPTESPYQMATPEHPPAPNAPLGQSALALLHLVCMRTRPRPSPAHAVLEVALVVLHVVHVTWSSLSPVVSSPEPERGRVACVSVGARAELRQIHPLAADHGGGRQRSLGAGGRMRRRCHPLVDAPDGLSCPPPPPPATRCLSHKDYLLALCHLVYI